jgi:hypothetical protein
MSTHTTDLDPSPEPDLIRETERARLRALVGGDIETAGRLHAAEFQLITPIGIALSKEDYLGAIANGQIKYLAWEPGPIAVRHHQSHAVIRYRARLEVVFGGHRVAPGDYWHTDTYEYRHGRWVVVWSQATAISQML